MQILNIERFFEVFDLVYPIDRIDLKRNCTAIFNK
jgi:hypothetical protein